VEPSGVRIGVPGGEAAEVLPGGGVAGHAEHVLQRDAVLEYIVIRLYTL